MKISKKVLAPGAIAVAVLAGVAGGQLINGIQANAATTPSTTTTTDTVDTPDTQPDPSQGGHVGSNGTKEVLLTGDTATKAKAAALAAVPGGTVQRVENDAEGATYEAHVTKSDGSEVTVKMDANFKVTSTEGGR